MRRAEERIDGREWVPDGVGPGDFMLQQDLPAHMRLLEHVAKAFPPRAIERSEMDVITDRALPIQSTVTCEMMGVSFADRERFTEWTPRATHLLCPICTDWR